MKTLFIVPAFQHQKELDCITSLLNDCDVLVIDDGSQPILSSKKPMIRHTKNRGYGAAQKTGFSFALARNYDCIALVHGDNQYSLSHIRNALDTMNESTIMLGSRFLDRSWDKIPYWRKWGNRILTSAANKKFHTKYSDLHTGARIYHRSFLSTLPYHSFSDGFLFDHQLLVFAMKSNISIQEFPIPAKYDASVSSISFPRSIIYGLGCMHGIIAASSP